MNQPRVSYEPIGFFDFAIARAYSDFQKFSATKVGVTLNHRIKEQKTPLDRFFLIVFLCPPLVCTRVLQLNQSPQTQCEGSVRRCKGNAFTSVKIHRVKLIKRLSRAL